MDLIGHNIPRHTVREMLLPTARHTLLYRDFLHPVQLRFSVCSYAKQQPAVARRSLFLSLPLSRSHIRCHSNGQDHRRLVNEACLTKSRLGWPTRGADSLHKESIVDLQIVKLPANLLFLFFIIFPLLAVFYSVHLLKAILYLLISRVPR